MLSIFFYWEEKKKETCDVEKAYHYSLSPNIPFEVYPDDHLNDVDPKVMELCNTLDKRYDPWIGNLIGANYKLNENVNILSWNYDTQIEMSYSDFIRKDDSRTVYDYLKTYHGDTNLYSRDDSYPYVKLNGSIMLSRAKGPNGITKHYSNLYLDRLDQNKGFHNYDKLLELITNFGNIIKQKGNEIHEPFLNFAWEGLEAYKGDNQENILAKRQIKNAIDLMVDTDVVVVLGYSFPNYNLDIDRLLFESIKDKANLKIYIQDTKEAYEGIKFRIKGLTSGKLQDDQFTSYTDLSQFLIPYELYS